MQIPLANIHWRFLLVRDDWGFQVNPLCRHDITSPFPPSGNGYVRNRDVNLAKSDHLKLFTARKRNIIVNILASTPTDDNGLFTVIHAAVTVRCCLLFVVVNVFIVHQLEKVVLEEIPMILFLCH